MFRVEQGFFMKLYYSSASPFARYVRVIIRLLDIGDIQEVSCNPLDNPEELLSANPLAQIPCLVLNDGAPLFDSEVIARYLDAEFGANQFFGQGSVSWVSQSQFSLIKGMLSAAVSLRQEQLRSEDGCDSMYWRSRFEQAILRGLMELERAGMTFSSELDARQIALVCLLDYLDFRHGDIAWRNLAPGLAAWSEQKKSLAVFSVTAP